jgi:hypothetical protein
LVDTEETGLSLQTRCDAYEEVSRKFPSAEKERRRSRERRGDIPCIVTRHAASVPCCVQCWLVYGSLSCDETTRSTLCYKMVIGQTLTFFCYEYRMLSAAQQGGIRQNDVETDELWRSTGSSLVAIAELERRSSLCSRFRSILSDTEEVQRGVVTT